MTVYKITGLLLGYSIVRPLTNFSPTMSPISPLKYTCAPSLRLTLSVYDYILFINFLTGIVHYFIARFKFITMVFIEDDEFAVTLYFDCRFLSLKLEPIRLPLNKYRPQNHYTNLKPQRRPKMFVVSPRDAFYLRPSSFSVDCV